MLSPPPLIQSFPVPENNATVNDSSTKFFGTVRQKLFDGISYYSPPPSYPNFFATGNEGNNKGFPYEIFRHCETENVRRNTLKLPPLSTQTFSVTEINATVMDSRTENFRTVRRKIFDRKSGNPHPSYPNFCDTRN